MNEQKRTAREARVPVKGIHMGDRGESFKMFLYNILKLGVPDSKLPLLFDQEALNYYDSAFTSGSVDSSNNYEYLEFLGDAAAGKFIAYYFSKEYPMLNCPSGVQVLAKLKIKYSSKATFSDIADKLGFWDYITATNNERLHKRKSLLEDTFEAFLGATEIILDREGFGLGYSCVHKILSKIFKDIKISLKYEDISDSKSRLKELFDHRKDLDYDTVVKKVDNVTAVSIYLIQGKKRTLVGEGKGALKITAEQKASENALKMLESMKITRPINPIFDIFCGKEPKVTTEEDVLEKCKGKEHINDLIPVQDRGGTSDYMATVLGYYCMKRDLSGVGIALRLGADPNAKDNHGLTCFDLFLIGRREPREVESAIRKFLRIGKVPKIEVNADVYARYGSVYERTADFKDDKFSLI